MFENQLLELLENTKQIQKMLNDLKVEFPDQKCSSYLRLKDSYTRKIEYNLTKLKGLGTSGYIVHISGVREDLENRGPKDFQIYFSGVDETTALRLLHVYVQGVKLDLLRSTVIKPGVIY